MTRRTLFVAALAAAILGPAPSQAYYHFLHSLKGGNAPEKFDLTTLPNQTVTFFVSQSGPTAYSATDTFNSVLSQIQQATLVWNGIASSSLRVSFGGLEDPTTLQNTPGGDVAFEDLPPGVEGFGGPTTLANPVTAPDGSQFFPVVRSVVHLSLNLNQAPGPSYDQSFLLTVLHEMGHAIGLQHTFTSATMSQATTRATTLTHAVAADDVAGISVLYPAASFSRFGSIAGTITAGGQGVALASVVAIQAGADAVSGVTNPDGTYRIDGIPPGAYAVYVHTMPPDANILGPDGNVVAGFDAVNSLFYGATTDFTQATAVTVTAGQVATGIDIQTTARAAVPLYDGQVYGYFNSDTIELYPAPVQISANVTPVVASIVGLGTNEPVAGLSVEVPGGAVSIASNGIVPLTSAVAGVDYTYAALYLNFNSDSQPGQQHMIFNTPDYMYVLPSALYLTLTGPPTLTGIADNGDGTLTVTGTNWAAGTSLYFDGLPAAIVSLDPVKGTAVVTAPPGANGQTSTLAAYNPDGQNSQILQSAAPVTWSYGKLPKPTITSIAPASLPAGAEAMIDITGTGFTFTPGLTTIGFGTSDIAVQQVYVLSPTHVQVDVSVSANAALSNPGVSVISGFQVATAPSIFEIRPPVAGLPAPYPVLFNGLQGLTGSYAGAIVSLYGANLAVAKIVPSLTIGGEAPTILYSSPSQINLRIPSDLPAGPAILTLNNGLQSAYPVTIDIDPPPAEIAAVQSSTGAYIYSANAAQQGNLLIVTLTGFAPEPVAINPDRVQVSVGGVVHNAIQVTPVLAGSVLYYQISFQLNANDPVGMAEPLIVYLDGRSSYPASIPVLAAPGASSN